jgi:hypothetical protein
VIVGTEGIFTWEENDLVLNDRLADVHYRVDTISGLRSLGELTLENDQSPGRTGEAPRRSTRAGKVVTFEGRIIANKTLVSLREAQGDLSAAFASTEVRKMIAGPHGSYTGPELPTRSFHAIALTCDPDEGRIESPNRSRSGGYEMPFTLSMRLDDPRVYHEGVVVDEEDDTAAAVSGAGVPFVPHTTVHSASAEGFELVLDNVGTAPADAIIYIYGPIVNPIISNETLGSFIRFRNLSIDDGDFITIDFRRRRIRRTADGANVRSKFDPVSTWWDQFGECLAPGENVIRLRGYRVLDGAKLRATFTPADW